MFVASENCLIYIYRGLAWPVFNHVYYMCMYVCMCARVSPLECDLGRGIFVFRLDLVCVSVFRLNLYSVHKSECGKVYAAAKFLQFKTNTWRRKRLLGLAVAGIMPIASPLIKIRKCNQQSVGCAEECEKPDSEVEELTIWRLNTRSYQ